MSDIEISDSAFHMWRSVFAVVHADGVVSDEEIRFMAEVLEDIPFSVVQKAVLLGDVAIAQDIEEMYGKITEVKDQAEFFSIARKLVHIDGDYSVEERDVMLKLKTLHVRESNIDHLVGHVELELEGEGPRKGSWDSESDAPAGDNLKDALYSFRDRFLEKIRS